MKKSTKQVVATLAPKLYLPLDAKHKLQFFGGKTLFELKQTLQTLGQQLKKTDEELVMKAEDLKSTPEDLVALQKSKSDIQMRFDIIKKQHDEMEAAQKQQMQRQNPLGINDDPKQKVLSAKAGLYRSVIQQKAVEPEILMALGDNDASGGNKILPKTVATEILMEPTVKNPLVGHSTHTQITNLEIPKLSYSLDDDDFILDGATAKELELTGDSVSFGRFKFKVFAEVSETVLHGSDVDLVTHVDKALQSGKAAKERKVAFTKTPKAGEEHMSFYRTATATLPAIKVVNGATKLKAIKAAIADLHEDYRENAKVFMTYTDYLDIIEDLSNGNTSLYAAQPEQILGKPAVFTDSAVDPVVGDFAYSHFNYDLNALYDRDKNVKTGMEQFVLTAWFDHQIKLASAFRIAEVTPTP